MKLIFDRLLALILLIPLSFFILFLSIIILCIDKFYPFFVSSRIGKNGKKFLCLKLQTLKPTTDQSVYNNPIKDSQRITKLGRFLRNHGWDELPQIYNILIGQMSFVGPRPIPESYYSRIGIQNPKHVKTINIWRNNRLRYLPGLSGWHQVHLIDHHIIKYDNEYFDNPSILKDLIIFYRSVIILIVGKKEFFKENIPDTYEYSI